MKPKIVVLPGDGIGPEVTAAALRVLQACLAGRGARAGHRRRRDRRRQRPAADGDAGGMPRRGRGAARRRRRPALGELRARGPRTGCCACAASSGSTRTCARGATSACRRRSRRPGAPRRHPGRARAVGRHLLRRAALAAGGRRTSTPGSDDARGARASRTWPSSSLAGEEARGLGRQGERPRLLAPVATRGRARSARSTRTSPSSTTTSTRPASRSCARRTTST